MKGVLILSEGRSGTNWLLSLCNSTGQLGKGAEWFSRRFIGRPCPKNKEDLLKMVLSNSSTENGFFSIKIFPAHVHFVKEKYGFDLVKYFTENHQIKIIKITRNDRMRQAISFAKGLQTGGWTAGANQSGQPKYDFDMISRCYFLICQSYSFWDSYLEINSSAHEQFIYEEMLKSPMPFLNSVADHAGVKVEKIEPSMSKIQRDSTSEEWRTRFLADLRLHDIVDASALSRKPKRHILNIMRFLAGKPMKPYPFLY